MATSSKDFPIDSGAAAPPAGGGYACGWAHAQGRRSSMEDEVILGTPLPAQADGAGDGGLQLWAVMDGHAGRRAVELLVTLLPEAFARATRQALTTSSSSSDTSPLLSPDDITHVLQTVDEQLLAASDAEGGWSDGATALLAITATSEHRRRPMQLIQLGDSQAVLCGAFGADALCPQHRVGEPEEDARLEALGTTVEDGRVVGGGAAVAVTRSLGDAPVKRGSAGGLIAVPAVSEHRLSAADELLLLGCDGLWDVMGAEDAYDIARKAGRGRDGTWNLEAAATALVKAALDRRTGDNVSVVALGLKQPRAQVQRGGGAATAGAIGGGNAAPGLVRRQPGAPHVRGPAAGAMGSTAGVQVTLGAGGSILSVRRAGS